LMEKTPLPLCRSTQRLKTTFDYGACGPPEAELFLAYRKRRMNSVWRSER